MNVAYRKRRAVIDRERSARRQARVLGTSLLSLLEEVNAPPDILCVTSPRIATKTTRDGRSVCVWCAP